MRRWLDRNGKGEAGVGSKWRGGGVTSRKFGSFAILIYLSYK
jgi:hypothetical protein